MNRRHLLFTAAALVTTTTLGGAKIAALAAPAYKPTPHYGPPTLVGHGLKDLSDVLEGRVPLHKVDALYLPPNMSIALVAGLMSVETDPMRKQDGAVLREYGATILYLHGDGTLRFWLPDMGREEREAQKVAWDTALMDNYRTTHNAHLTIV